VVTAEGTLVGLLTGTAMVDALSDAIWAEGDAQ
jgi:Mg2+/citrate symporter